jgi:transposase-like protein
MAYRACQKSKAPKLPRSGSNNIPSASSISTIAEVRTEEGKLYLFVAIDRTSKVAFARLFDKANTAAARAFLEQLIEAIPYNIEVVLTDNGIQFADLPKYRSGATARVPRPSLRSRLQPVRHRASPHQWTNGQVERMNRTLKEATVQRYYDDTHGQLRRHLADFLAAYNFAKRLKC